IENNAGDGVRVAGEMANSGQPFVTDFTGNEIAGNASNGIHLENSSNNWIGEAGAITNLTANTIGNDRYDPAVMPNGGDGVLIESDGISQASNNKITENYIGGNNGNGVSLTGGGTSDNSLVNNEIGWGLASAEAGKFFNVFALPNKLDGVAISVGANN